MEETDILVCKPVDTPIDTNQKLGLNERSTCTDKGIYRGLVEIFSTFFYTVFAWLHGIITKIFVRDEYRNDNAVKP